MAQKKLSTLNNATDQGTPRPSAGFTVPQDYFEKFAEQFEAQLPFRAELEAPETLEASRTTWQKIRPYVYMAAMFAGVWCMLQMFYRITNNGTSMAIESNPIIADALTDDNFVFDYVYSDANSWDIVDEMVQDGTQPEDIPFEELTSDEELVIE